MAAENRYTRVSLDLSPEAAQQLEELLKKANTTSKAQLVRTALRLFGWYLDKRARGYRVQLIKDDQVTEVELFL